MRSAPAPITTTLLLFALVIAVGSPAAQLAWIIPAVLGVANEALLFYASLRSPEDEPTVIPGTPRDTAENWTTE